MSARVSFVLKRTGIQFGGNTRTEPGRSVQLSEEQEVCLGYRRFCLKHKEGSPPVSQGAPLVSHTQTVPQLSGLHKQVSECPIHWEAQWWSGKVEWKKSIAFFPLRCPLSFFRSLRTRERPACWKDRHICRTWSTSTHLTAPLSFSTRRNSSQTGACQLKSLPLYRLWPSCTLFWGKSFTL